MTNSTLVIKHLEGPEAERVGDLVWDTLVLLLGEASRAGGWQVGLALVSHTLGQIAAASATGCPPSAIVAVTEMLQANLRNGVEGYAVRNLPPEGRA